MKNFYMAAGLAAASNGLSLSAYLQNGDDTVMGRLMGESPGVVVDTLTEYLASHERYDTTFVLEFINDDAAAITGNYYAYEDITISDHPVYFNDEDNAFIVWYVDGWVVADYRYYLAFECECYDGLGHHIKSSNGDVPI